MRIELTLDNPKASARIPINYNHFLAGTIYRTLASASAEYADNLHNVGYEFQGKRFKLFTFSNLRASRRRVERETLVVESRCLAWQVSSPLEEFLRNFASGLLERGEVRIDAISFPVREIRFLPEPQFSESTQFICLSPITVSTHIIHETLNSLHYCRLNDGFYEKVVDNLRRKYTLLTGQSADGLDLTMEFDQGYTTRHGGKIHKLIGYKDTKIFAYQAPFIAIGSRELMRVGYDCGFGDGNSKGLGMVDVRSSLRSALGNDEISASHSINQGA